MQLKELNAKKTDRGMVITLGDVIFNTNQALSERRAEAVQKALAERGIDGGRIAMRGYGESSPVANNETAAGRQLNRRVEIVLSDDGGNIVPHK